MKKTLTILFLIITNILLAQTPTTITFRVAHVSGLKYAVVYEYLGHADYTDLTQNPTNNSVMINATDGTGISSIENRYGSTWALQAGFPVDHTNATSSCPDNATPQYDLYYFSSSTEMTFGNRTSTSTTYIDTAFLITMTNAVSGGEIRANGGQLSSTTLDQCIAFFDNSMTFDADGPNGNGGSYGGQDIEGVGVPAPLPVDLMSFDANIYNDYDAKLDWATASELNNSHFEVQRSFDGYNFTTIDEVKGNGTSHSLINYSYIDETIPTHQNIVYYRLNQVDYNGESELSDIRLVQFEGFSNAPLVVYPNPTKSETTILLGDNVSQGEYTITDLVGKQWMADVVRAGSKSIELDFSNLPAGVYIATLNTENDSKHVRIVKK